MRRQHAGEYDYRQSARGGTSEAGDADLVDDAPENVALVNQGLAILTDNAVPVASPAALVRTKDISDQPGA